MQILFYCSRSHLGSVISPLASHFENTVLYEYGFTQKLAREAWQFSSGRPDPANTWS